MPPSILVLSDVHFGDLAQNRRLGSKGDSNPNDYRGVAEDIQEALGKCQLQPNLLVIPGDLTSRGSPQEFQESAALIKAIAQQLGISEERTLITYGNHDLDWKVCQIDPAMGPKRDSYCSLAAQIGHLFAPSPNPRIPGPVVGSGIHHLGDCSCLVLNSGIECYAKPEGKEGEKYYPHGKLAESQFNWLKNLKPEQMGGKIKICVIHHHLSNIPYPKHWEDVTFLAEGAEVSDILGSLGVDIVIHGHRHHPAVYTLSKNGWRHPMTTFCAGSFGVCASHRSGGCIPNTMHVIDFGERTEKGNMAGKITTFEQLADDSWAVPATANANIALDPAQWFGSSETLHNVVPEIEILIEEAERQLVSKDAVAIPSHDSLPINLRCLRLEQINAEIDKVASIKQIEVTGQYPKRCIVMKTA